MFDIQKQRDLGLRCLSIGTIVFHTQKQSDLGLRYLSGHYSVQYSEAV